MINCVWNLNFHFYQWISMYMSTILLTLSPMIMNLFYSLKRKKKKLTFWPEPGGLRSGERDAYSTLMADLGCSDLIFNSLELRHPFVVRRFEFTVPFSWPFDEGFQSDSVGGVNKVIPHRTVSDLDFAHSFLLGFHPAVWWLHALSCRSWPRDSPAAESVVEAIIS